MPITLPVPSKGALRTLRHLAFGTSCTVALSAGLLTEDRRRRIHSAREVHENACKIKGARGYHSGSARVLIDISMGDVSGFEDLPFPPADRTMTKLTKETNKEHRQSAIQPTSEHIELVQIGTAWPGDISTQETGNKSTPAPKITDLIDSRPLVAHRQVKARRVDDYIKKRLVFQQQARPDVLDSDAEGELLFEANRQRRLSADVDRIVSSGDPADVEAAASRFLDTFEEGIDIPRTGIDPQLLQTAANLSELCMKHDKIHLAQAILKSILPHFRGIEETLYQRFSPHTIIKHILDDAHLTGSSLNFACVIYTQRFEKGCQIPDSVDRQKVSSLGTRLFEEARQRGWHGLTCKIFFSRLRYGARTSLSAEDVGCVIDATHKLGDYKGVGDLFWKYFTKTTPHSIQLSKVVRLVVDAAFQSGQARRAERVLAVSSKMAKLGGFKTSTTSLLNFLGGQWRMTRNIEITIESFERFKPLLADVNHPSTVYGAIIQWCIEADKESIAVFYYNELKKVHTVNPADLRIFGHFALAKAKRNDWPGAREDLKNMGLISAQFEEEYGQTLQEIFSHSFVPILKVFADSHSVCETEEFIRGFMDSSYFLLTPYISNIMISEYAAAKETDSLLRWVDIAHTAGCPIDSVSINIILKYCRLVWDFSYEEAFQLYKLICARGNGAFTEDQTVEHLAQIALTGSPGTVKATKRLRRLQALRKHKHTWNSAGTLRIMSTNLITGNPAATLKAYESALKSEIPIGPKHVAIAVAACLRHKSISQTQILIREAYARGTDVQFAAAHVLIEQMKGFIDQSPDEFRSLVLTNIATLETAGITIDQSIVTHTISLLERSGEVRQALDFWSLMSERLGLMAQTIHLSTLTVLLNVYASLESRQGVLWISHTLMHSGSIPDRRFKIRVAVMINVVKKKQQQKPLDLRQIGYMDALESLRRQVKQARERRSLEKAKFREMAMSMLNLGIESQPPANLLGSSASDSRTVTDGISIAQTSHETCDGGFDPESDSVKYLGKAIGVAG
ncbi:hypothetical protein GLAREA_08342 [Glarea lozoyensis ATCC 20868]|uniref:Uncharacterized protein n=1 Tax=Glarea lozoyensis (strain ATCC 20868 / MF5171) TaxID=1116229 RepID=S3CER3_GLAL2|nr:uncharacterized protein GLAREA_08342 [Glarea lozoyensis ATCC 20868]EPE24490.1 hypothetical protein GLAREA_08342 [Glarea lozoyensis ATCC 20868]